MGETPMTPWDVEADLLNEWKAQKADIVALRARLAEVERERDGFQNTLRYTNAEIDRLTAALARLVAALDRCESNRGRFSCVDAHDSRCNYAMKAGARCQCGSEELESALEAARGEA